MSDKKVNVTITCGCRAAGKSLTLGKVYALAAADAKLVVSAGRAIYGGPHPNAKSKAKSDSK